MRDRGSDAYSFALAAVLSVGGAARAGEDVRIAFPNPWAIEGQWFKGNLHCHTTESDGKLKPEEVVQFYRTRGYQFISITDHWKITRVPSLAGEFLSIPGAEVDLGKNEMGETYHFNGIGLRTLPGRSDSPLDAVAFMKSQGSFVSLNHPHWSSMSMADLAVVEWCHAIEVFNSSTETGSLNGYGTPHWDYLLYKGMKMRAVATDDAHEYDRPGAGGGWVQVRAKELTEVSILDALRSGFYYSSAGPEIRDLTVTASEIRVATSPCACIGLRGLSGHGWVVWPEKGQATISIARWDLADVRKLTKERGWFTLRVEAKGPAGERAWSNPIRLDKVEAGP